MTKILICGDSWGCGEWAATGGVTHKGLETYFLDLGFCVDNISLGGQTNEETLEKLINADLSKYDYIFLWVTDTVRSITSKYSEPEKFWTPGLSIETIYERNKSYLKKFYAGLGTLDAKIYLLGGVQKVNKKMVKRYKNIEILIPSCIEFLTKDENIAVPDIVFNGGSNGINTRIPRDTIDWTINQIDIWNSIGDTKFFSTDGKHPDRHGHWEIFKYIIEKLKINRNSSS